MKPKSAIFVLIFVILFIVAAPLLLSSLNDRLSLPRLWFVTGKSLGQFLLLAGGLALLNCFVVIKKFGQGTPVPIEPPKKLVTQGLFQFTRNPMYLALFAIILGEFFFFGTLLLFIYFLLIILGFHLYVVKKEEPELEKKFGQEYLEYKEKTPRWFTKKSFPEMITPILKKLRKKKAG